MPSEVTRITSLQSPPNLGKTLGDGQWIETGCGHRVWWTEGGDPRGLPVLIVHGGPGGRSRLETARWWAGLPVRWICIDQRGCGQSTPKGLIRHNTVEHLLADMERLRLRLGIERWALAAGSWGAYVALAYAARHAHRVRGLFLRSPFLGSRMELGHYLEPWAVWFGEGPAGFDRAGWSLGQVYQHGAAASWHPDTGLPPTTADEDTASRWQGALATAFEQAQSEPGGVRDTRARCTLETLAAWSEEAQAAWQIHAHYASTRWTVGHDAWPWARAVMARLAGPVALVHGRRDAVCPVSTTQQLAALRPDADAWIVAEGGHRMNQAPMAAALQDAACAWAAALG